MQEVILAPRIVRIFAGIDFVLMFAFAMLGVLITGLSTFFTDILNYAQATDPALYVEIINELTDVGLSVPFIVSGFTLLGAILTTVSLVGMIVALGTAYKKPWAITLGVGVSILAISGGIVSYVYRILFPFQPVGPLNFIDLALSLFFGILAINIFFVGAFLIWQLDEQPRYNIRMGRFILIWNIDALCLLLTTILYVGIGFVSSDLLTILGVVYIAVAIIAVINVLVRPLFTKLVSLVARWWLGFAISFVFMFIINGIILWQLPRILPGFYVVNLPAALVAGLILAAVNTLVVNIVGLDDDITFFNDYVAKQIWEEMAAIDIPQTHALVAVEIDGLSFTAIQKALKREYMPTLQGLLKSGSHLLTNWDCGIPSMTSSCQAGIMHGNNDDIPAFRWYLKPEKRMIVSNNPQNAQEIDQRASSGQGILRNGGSSVSNLISGDASYSFFTMSTLTQEDAKAGRRRSQDLYYYLLDPYAMNRSIIYTIWDILVEFGQIIKQTITRRKPRMNRLAHAYPVVRAATNIFMRDVATSMVIQDILRGTPAIYVTYLGYDEIAHHSGPLTSDAIKALHGLDKQIRRILHAIKYYAPRPYHLFILSDHGQSTGWTFKQRYKITLKDLITELLEGKVSVGEMEALDAHRGYVAGLVDDMNAGRAEAKEEKKEHGVLKYFHRQASKKDEPPPDKEVEAKDVLVCASGNLAQIYFTTTEKRETLQNLETQFPGFISKLVAHDGIGFAIVMDEKVGPVLLSEEGAIELRTGKIKGKNPLTPYGNEGVRRQQLLRLAEFPSSGELILISPVYEDGSVAAFEELIGNHGGIGGDQTNAILVHPVEFKVESEKIINSEQIFEVLDQVRSD
ncbi:MAG: alkaline phosphatase family protein [Candidatus Hermodarchaeota archaeon]